MTVVCAVARVSQAVVAGVCGSEAATGRKDIVLSDTRLDPPPTDPSALPALPACPRCSRPCCCPSPLSLTTPLPLARGAASTVPDERRVGSRALTALMMRSHAVGIGVFHRLRRVPRLRLLCDSAYATVLGACRVGQCAPTVLMVRSRAV